LDEQFGTGTGTGKKTWTNIFYTRPFNTFPIIFINISEVKTFI